MKKILALIALLLLAGCAPGHVRETFNVREFGASGLKAQDATKALQDAVDACAAAGGGTVLIPPGEYTSGTIRLRSHVRVYVEGGATIFVTKDTSRFDRGHNGICAALFYGTDLENVTVEGRGTLDGQAEYEWRLNDWEDDFIRPNQRLWEAGGKPLMRAFPVGLPKETVFPRMFLLLRCKDVRIAGLTMIRSRSWNINPYDCDRVVIDGVSIFSSLKEAVWADGIDPDGCRDVRISNSTIETGDDAIVFYSSQCWGTPKPCEDITVTNCRISSASSALKFCDGNSAAIRRVTVDNCVVSKSNRGIAFMNFDGGIVSDVVFSNLVVECERYDWFWWGDGDPLHVNLRRRSDIHASITPDKCAPAGIIRNVLLHNVLMRGQGACNLMGHPDHWLEDVKLENVRLFLTATPDNPLEKAKHAMSIRWAKNLTLKDVEIVWGSPESTKWESALHLEDIQGLVLDGFRGGPAPGAQSAPAVVLHQVDDAVVRNCRSGEGAGAFLSVTGDASRGIRLVGNDLRRAKRAWVTGDGAKAAEVKESGTLLP